VNKMSRDKYHKFALPKILYDLKQGYPNNIFLRKLQGAAQSTTKTWRPTQYYLNMLIENLEKVEPSEPEEKSKIVVHESSEPDRKLDCYILTEDSSDKYSLELVPWSEIMYMPVVPTKPFDLFEIVAIILCEISFWGDTEQELLELIDTMKEQLNDRNS